MSLQYGVIGVGAIGGFYGGLLARSNKRVKMLFHSDYEVAYTRGLTVESVLGDYIITDVDCAKDASELSCCDVILVCMKAIYKRQTLAILKKCCKSGTTVIFIQNGLMAEEYYADHLPECAIGGGLGFICSEKVGPAHIRHYDYGQLTVGFKRKPDDSVIDQMKADFAECGIDCIWAADLWEARWRKLVWNIPFNGPCLAYRKDTMQLLTDPETRRKTELAIYEVIAAANACGAKIESEFGNLMITRTLDMKPYYPSMYHDWEAGRSLELDAIYDIPIRVAAHFGYDMREAKSIRDTLLIEEKEIARDTLFDSTNFCFVEI